MKKNEKVKSKKGFSLVETMISIFVFSFVGVMLAGSFASFLKSYATAKKTQKSAESAQYAMNLISKTMRASVVESVSSTRIQMYDNSQGLCVVYEYDGSVVKFGSISKPSIEACTWSIALSPLTNAGDIKGMKFTSTNGTATTHGKVMVFVQLSGGGVVQSSVSLRQVGAFFVATCSDGIQNGTETGVDCGGSCSACVAAPTCSDGVKNGTETGVDCGGSCSACVAAPTCSDGVQNGTETGVDCGGSCVACVAAPTCSDGVKNGTETGVDCGGLCSACTYVWTCDSACWSGITNTDKATCDWDCQDHCSDSSLQCY